MAESKAKKQKSTLMNQNAQSGFFGSVNYNHQKGHISSKKKYLPYFLNFYHNQIKSGT